MKTRRSDRLIDMTRYLLERPHTLISLTFFSERYESAKSSISEDLAIIKRTFKFRGIGILETIPGAAGGARFIPSISEEETRAFIGDMTKEMSEKDRLLPGGYVYLSDLLGRPDVLRKVGRVIARQYIDKQIDAVMTVATKGGSHVLVVDDFMKGGGTVNGMKSMIEEFESELVGITVFAEGSFEGHRMVDDYTSLLKVDKVNTLDKTIHVSPGNYLERVFGKL